ncbi:Glycosyl hydrolase family 2, sugar binding domain-containing protein [Cladophialophora immunda]|nr:Glycosyl hydrolase family 2, sugar binding domain-containing protein [Cladophialophora immunda]
MAATRKTLPLHNGWRYKALSPSTSSQLSSSQPSRPLPTEIHLDLLANGVIPDPFVGKNEEAVQWVGEQTWLYELYFELPADAIGTPHQRAALVFDGLDTFATVKLNGQDILKSDNMFVGHRIEISEDMLVRKNGCLTAQCLQIIFENAERIGDQEVLKYPSHDWFTFNAGTARLATRKAQYHYGWDWGPKLMTCGPWKPIYLDLYSSRISDISVHTTLGSDLQYAEVQVVVIVDGPATQANLKLCRAGVVQQSQTVDVEQHIARAVFKLQTPDLWWPFTLGEANLYEASVCLYQPQDSEVSIVDEMSKAFGIRKVELVQRPLPDQEGSTFFFKINNVPIFAAGSCWIPADSFLTRISAQRYRDWVKLARDSNQVMIRIWGGGVYEHGSFYDACDQMGVLVWQDFMFACGNFPAHEQMRNRVAVEAEQNVRRLRHHPSIVLWCGNNEDYIIPVLRQIEYDQSEQDAGKILKSSFPARYFYEHMLPAICKDLSPATPYWPGSPFGGTMANSQQVGDIHQWHVWHLEMFPYQDFPRLAGRFVSEFGMQALPGLKTVQDFFPPGYSVTVDGDISEDECLKWHNKMEDGGDRIAHYGNANIKFETRSLPAYIYSTQLIQSETLSTAYRSWRRLWRGSGKEYCGGALVWQLNDCWPVTSWALADYYLRPKMAYWAVKRECAGITAGMARVKKDNRTDGLEVWAVNMTLSDIKVDVHVDGWSVVTGEAVFHHVMLKAVTLKMNQSTELGRLDLNACVPSRFQPSDKYSGFEAVVFAVRLVEPLSDGKESVSSATKRGSPPKILARHTNFHEPLKEVPFQARARNLGLRIVRDGSDTVVEATANLPIKGLLVQVADDPDAKWEDNGVDLVPGQLAGLKFMGRGLDVGQEHRLRARWMGGDWRGEDNVRPSL